jgi:Fe-S oxidoreductase
MEGLKFNPEVCEKCESVDCLTRCQHLNLDKDSARKEIDKIIRGEASRVLTDCLTCYACEEYCPHGNHPFYLIVERQEEKGIWPVPIPLTKQQILMMAPRGKISPEKVEPPVVNMCFFPMLVKSVRGSLFEGCSTIVGSDIF